MGITPKVGSRVITDARLKKGDVVGTLVESDWAAADFRLEGDSYWGHPAMAVKVKVTGRKVRHGILYAPAIRVKVTFPGDGEAGPDVSTGGWMVVD